MFLWDYGSLSYDEESKIIGKIVLSINDELDNMIDSQMIEMMAKAVIFSQAFTRTHEANWAVSLRDVKRFQVLFCYFYKSNFGSTKRNSL